MPFIRTTLRLLRWYMVVLMAYVFYELSTKHPEETLRTTPNKGTPVGNTLRTTTEHEGYTVVHVIEDGIERISYYPKERKHDTPIVFQHGMWHGAFTWETWQAEFALRGWESHAHSLPGHGLSPVQRPIVRCTLDYYLAFLKREMERHERKPILIGHSMGGALTQWYLKYVGDDLPSAVLVAPWVSHASLADGLKMFAKLDPLGVVLTLVEWSARPYVRTPEVAAAALLSPDSLISAQELHKRLTPESALVMMQHNPPFWSPLARTKTRLMWLGAERDALISLDAQRRSADHYRATFHVVRDAAHNIMMEPTQAETAALVDAWLGEQGIE